MKNLSNVVAFLAITAVLAVLFGAILSGSGTNPDPIRIEKKRGG